MADAAAPQNSISTGTSMRMSVKVKYVLWRVLKDASQDSQKQRAAGEEGKKKKKNQRKARRERTAGKNENNVSPLCYHPTGTQRRPTLTTDCE